ncbi:CMD domain protein [Rhizobium tumorigenes]|uniref:CMD domain protein n=1 Tax=Rhizobium tumorigenes TaxID=2041385 RepID=UPI00241CFF3F|nr:CMD domain protein [Rhizobium tumorigenes]WFS03501.1 CMD domain protein [Rhizobium tumorigenes]
MTSSKPDVIDLLAGISAGSNVDRIRSERPETRTNAQQSYLALFEPAEPGDVSRTERLAVAAFVAGLHRADAVAEFYAAGLAEIPGSASLLGAINAEVEKGRTQGPYGRFPSGPLSAEDKPGPAFVISEFNAVTLGKRLTAALQHSHLLMFRPRESSPEALQKLLDAGWSTTAIVTLSQILAFLAFQIRVVAGLTALAAAGTKPLAAANTTATANA